MLHTHEPWPEEKMKYTFPMFTICELLRTVYSMIDDPDKKEQAKLLCRTGITIAKAMDKKLKGYRADWDVGFYPPTDPGLRRKP